MYTSSTSISTTMGFVSLDTTGFQNHYFTDWGTQGYYPRQNELLFAVTNGDPDVQKIKIEDLIYLGDCKNYVEGTEIIGNGVLWLCIWFGKYRHWWWASSNLKVKCITHVSFYRDIFR